MFQELIELFKRLVAAHEKQAEAAMIMAQKGGGCESQTDQNAAPPLAHAEAEAGAAAGKPAEEKPKRGGRKTKDTPPTSPATEGEGEGEGASESPAKDLPPVDPKPEAPAEPEITTLTPSLEALKAAAGLYCARRKVAGSEAPAADCAALLQNFAGVGKTAEVPVDKRKACLDAFEADWMPNAEEEL